jgi:hypothetical protein
LVIFLVVAAHNIPGEPLQRALILDVFAQFIDKSDAVSLAIVIGRLAWCLEAMEGRFEAVVRPKHELVAHVTDYHMVDVDATMGEIWTYDKHFLRVWLTFAHESPCPNMVDTSRPGLISRPDCPAFLEQQGQEVPISVCTGSVLHLSCEVWHLRRLEIVQ